MNGFVFKNKHYKYQKLNCSKLMMYTQRDIIQYDIYYHCHKEYKNMIEPDHKILTVSRTWAVDNVTIQCIHSKSKTYKNYSLTNQRLSKGKNFKFRVKSIQCGEYHQLFLCQNGDCYGQGNNNYGQLGYPKFINQIINPRLIDYNVLSVVTMPYASFITKEEGIYSSGKNICACIGHSIWKHNLYEFQIIDFTYFENYTVNTGYFYSLFFTQNKCYFLGESNTLLHFDYHKPLQLLSKYQIVKCYPAYHDIYFIIQLHTDELAFFTFGMNFLNRKKDSWEYLDKVYERIGCNMPIIDIVVMLHSANNQIFIVQAAK